MKKISTCFKAIVFVMLVSSLFERCAIIRPGQIGIRQQLGVIKGKPIQQGVRFYNPFITKIVKINVRTVEIFNNLPLPTKEGLSINAEISLLYHVKSDSANDVYTKFGTNYQEVVVLSNFRATAREISARYYAKELYSTERKKVENEIANDLRSSIDKYGFIVDAVLLKDIVLPPLMVQAVQEKVVAEQAVLKMEFVIQQQKKEAERRIIEATAIKRAQNIIDSSLTDELLQYNRIEMLKSLTNSPNTKIVITDGGRAPQIFTDTEKE